jgi:hypothetical protein
MTQGGLFDDERTRWEDAGRCARCGCTLWRTGAGAVISKISLSRYCPARRERQSEGHEVRT